ncbi:hypothetical protein EON77_18500, partial [bacterium]
MRIVEAPRLTLPIDKPLDYYMVVNDLGVCGDRFSTGGTGLTVQITQLQPAGVRGVALGRAMSTTIDALRERARNLATQGEILPSEAAQLKSEAFERLTTACSCDPRTYPSHYLGFYDAWVDSELVRLERLVAIRKAEFSLVQLATELKAYADDLGAARDQGRLLELLPMWTVNNFAGDKLRIDMVRVISLLNEMHPVGKIRYPAALASIQNSSTIQGHLRSLLNDASVKPLDALASQLDLVATEILASFRDEVRKSPEASQTTVQAGISFVRPDLYSRDASGRSVVAHPETLSGFAPVSEARSRAVWELARAGKRVPFPIAPSDLFGAASTQLSCVYA